MAKRGEVRPWRVSYEWDNGAKGTDTYSTQDTAELHADKIRRSAERQERTVVVTVVDRRTL